MHCLQLAHLVPLYNERVLQIPLYVLFKQANSRGSCVKSKSIFCITKHLCQIAFGKKLDRPELANGLSGFKCLIYSV